MASTNFQLSVKWDCNLPQSYFLFVWFFGEAISWPLEATGRSLMGNASMKADKQRGSLKVISHVLEARFVAINSRSVNIFRENLCKLEFPSQIRTSRKFSLQRSNWILRRLLRDRDDGWFLRIFPQHHRPPLHVLQFSLLARYFLMLPRKLPQLHYKKIQKINFLFSRRDPQKLLFASFDDNFLGNGVERSSFIKSVTVPLRKQARVIICVDSSNTKAMTTEQKVFSDEISRNR